MTSSPHLSRLQRLGGWLAASDPALTRLRLALRTTLTLAAVSLSLVALHALVPLPVPAYGVALVTALQGALQIKESRTGARARTRLYASLAGFAAVASTVALSPSPRAVDLVFLAVVFAAVYARRFGARGNAIGMYAFMCYSIAAYLHPGMADLWAVALAIALSSAVAHLVRNHVLPESPVRDFRVTMLAVESNLSAFETAMQRLERRLADTKAETAAIDARRNEAAQAEARLKDAIIAAESLMPLEAGGEESAKEAANAARRDMIVALFDLQLAAETRFHAGEAAKGNHGAAATKRLRTALAETRKAAARLPAAAFFSEVDPAVATPRKGEAGWLADPSLRLAIQVTLASAIAMTAGGLISETRWFWAILTAFLVFTNTRSRGDTAVRALARAGGTLAGIIVGIGLATLLGGQLPVSVALIALFVFMGFYLLQVSYAALTFCVTIVLSLLYGLIGQFTPDLLILRLEETLIGSAAGLFIAFFVFPKSTTAAVREGLDAFLSALDALLVAAGERVRGERSRGLLRAARLLDKRHLELVAAARPLGGPWSLVRKPGRVRRTLIAFRSCAYWGHVLARGLTGDPPGEKTDADTLLAEIAALRESVALARDNSGSFFERAADAPPKPTEEKLARLDEIETREDPRFALAVIARILERTHGGPRDANDGAVSLAAAPGAAR